LPVEVGYTLYIICKNGEGAKIFIPIKSNLKTAFYKYNFNKSNLKTGQLQSSFKKLEIYFSKKVEAPRYFFTKSYNISVILRAKSNPKKFLIDSRARKLKK
jgi:hypothetical protein